MGYALPSVTSARRKTGCANRIFSVQRPFLVCRSVLRALGYRDSSHSATKIKVDVGHLVRTSELSPCPFVVILGQWPEKCRSNAP